MFFSLSKIFINMGYSCVICGDSEIYNFYPKRKNKCKVCLSKEYKNRGDKDEYIKKQKEWRSNNLIHYRVMSAKHRATRKGFVFEITDDDIVEKLKSQDGKCFISKKPISMNEKDWYSLSLDRLDREKGYTKDNVVLCCYSANIGRNENDLETWKKFLSLILN